MPFGGKVPDTARSQKDIVESDNTNPTISEVDVKLPGLDLILDMSDEELVEFFSTALKARAHTQGIIFKLGDYKAKEVQARVPGASNMHERSFKDCASIIVSALKSHPNVVGLRLSIDKIGDIYTSMLYISIADAPPNAPQMLNGKLVKDREYNPSLVLRYRKR